MKNLKLILLTSTLLFITTCSSLKKEETSLPSGKINLVRKSRCIDEKDENGEFWARSDGRSQGGGFIWFTGKGTSNNYQSSFENAEGQAISRLVKECGFAHKSAKFHERCANKEGENYLSFVRLSIDSEQCKKIGTLEESTRPAFVNKEFNRLYLNYLKNVENKELVCTFKDPETCLSLARQENINGNLELASKYARISCENSTKEKKGEACFYAGIYLYDLNKDNDATDSFQSSCLENYVPGCLKAGALLTSQKKLRKSILFLGRACSGKENASGCGLLGSNLDNLGQDKKATQILRKSCKEYKDMHSCGILGAILSRKGKPNLKHEALKAYGFGCKLGFEESCFEAGNFILKIKRQDKLVKGMAKYFFDLGCNIGNKTNSCEMKKRLMYESSNPPKGNNLESACNNGDSKSCLKIGAAFMALGAQKKNDSMISKSIPFLSRSCNLKNAKGCNALGEVYLFFRDKIKASEKFKMACKLGLSESCKRF